MTAHIVRRAIIPAGDFGAGFLPAAKAVPQEMLPLVDRPLIQYAVEEALAAGIDEIVIVTGRGKGAIEDHFDFATELEDALRRNDKRGALDAIEASRVRCGVIAYVRQQEPLGLGHALWCARHVVGNEPFAVLVPNEVIQAKAPCLAQMAAGYRQTGGNMVAVTPVARNRAARYGVIAATRRDDRLLAASGVAARPADGDGTEKWAAIGRFILDSTMLGRLGAAGEIPFADALAGSADDGALYGYAFAGRHFDCDDALGLLEANLAFTLARADLAPAARGLLSRYAHRADETNWPPPAAARKLRIPA
ncbi:MAG: UTP--glucose-1-phosphate uridylyltransferase [Stellaceae bacterium]